MEWQIDTHREKVAEYLFSVLSELQRFIPGGRSWGNGSVGLQDVLNFEGSLISVADTTSNAAVRMRPWKLFQMGFVCSQGTHMSETTLAPPNRKLYLGSGQHLPSFVLDLCWKLIRNLT